jgi:hypothetical protein
VSNESVQATLAEITCPPLKGELLAVQLEADCDPCLEHIACQNLLPGQPQIGAVFTELRCGAPKTVIADEVQGLPSNSIV